MTPKVRLDAISWSAGSAKVLSNVSADIQAGEFVALMGRNGAGKSTLVDLLAGVRQPTSGRVLIDGRARQSWEARSLAREVGHLPQVVRPDLPFTAEALVLMGRYPHTDAWFESPGDRDAVERAMRRTDCFQFRARSVSTLSGGERQRVLLAACLAQEPHLLLCDEPSTFLDVDQQLHCFGLLKEEVDRGATCVAVTHDINLALAFCSRLIVLGDRTILLDLPTREAAGSSDWLSLFSPRLTVTKTAEGRPWVHYH